MIAIVVATAAWADTPSLAPYPSPPSPVAQECPQAVALEPGHAVGRSMVGTDGKAICAAVVMPVSQQVDLLAIEAWAQLCRNQYAVVVQGGAVDLAAVTVERDQLRAQAVRLHRWYNRPLFGAIVGASLATGFAVAVAL